VIEHVAPELITELSWGKSSAGLGEVVQMENGGLAVHSTILPRLYLIVNRKKAPGEYPTEAFSEVKPEIRPSG
jgi:hypothetical protein